MVKKRVGYFRLSTVEQAQTNASRNQEARLREAGRKKIYSDIESGADPDRPEFNKVLRLITGRKVSRVIATRMDRLVRDSDHL
jgi:DNA invertase Pin-like site-specific DNA recombinase